MDHGPGEDERKFKQTHSVVISDEDMMLYISNNMIDQFKSLAQHFEIQMVSKKYPLDYDQMVKILRNEYICEKNEPTHTPDMGLASLNVIINNPQERINAGYQQRNYDGNHFIWKDQNTKTTLMTEETM